MDKVVTAPEPRPSIDKKKRKERADKGRRRGKYKAKSAQIVGDLGLSTK